MLRAVPARTLAAASRSKALRSLIFSFASSLHWAMVSLPILFLFGSPLPFSALTASFKITLAGGLFASKLEGGGLLTVATTPTTLPLRVAGAAVGWWVNLAGVLPRLTRA